MSIADQINYFKAIKICIAIQEMDKQHIPYSAGKTLEKRGKLMDDLRETGFTLNKGYGYFPIPSPNINPLPPCPNLPGL